MVDPKSSPPHVLPRISAKCQRNCCFDPWKPKKTWSTNVPGRVPAKIKKNSSVAAQIDKKKEDQNLQMEIEEIVRYRQTQVARDGETVWVSHGDVYGFLGTDPHGPDKCVIPCHHPQKTEFNNCSTVGGFNLPLWKMMDFVSWDSYSQCIHIYIYIYIYTWKNKIHVPNHQPAVAILSHTGRTDHLKVADKDLITSILVESGGTEKRDVLPSKKSLIRQLTQKHDRLQPIEKC